MIFIIYSVVSVAFSIYLTWEAKWISYLNARIIDSPIDGIDSLMETSNYKIALMPDSSEMEAFKFSKTSQWKKAWTERIEPNLGFYSEYTQSKEFYLLFLHIYKSYICFNSNLVKLFFR